uniref:Uncharacterized protein n=1 Tax=Ursus maritimus TaxID=29073 RepID=A0A452U2R5_URSMA
MLWDHPSPLQGTSMPLTLVFRRLAPLKSPLHLKSLFSELTPLKLGVTETMEADGPTH